MPKYLTKTSSYRKNEVAIFSIISIVIVVSIALTAYLGIMSGKMTPSINDHIKTALAQKDITVTGNPTYEFDQVLSESYLADYSGQQDATVCRAGGYYLDDHVGKTVHYSSYQANNIYTDAASRIPLQVWVISEQDKVLCLFFSQRSGGAYIAPSTITPSEASSIQ